MTGLERHDTHFISDANDHNDMAGLAFAGLLGSCSSGKGGACDDLS